MRQQIDLGGGQGCAVLQERQLLGLDREPKPQKSIRCGGMYVGDDLFFPRLLLNQCRERHLTFTMALKETRA